MRRGLAALLALAVAAPPQASADPVPMGPYVVFFDLNSSALRPEGRDILESAARAYAYHDDRSPVALELAGFADRSGSAGHNRALAERRARTVRAVLVEHGVRADRIAVEVHGEDPTRLRVQTGDGVRHDQNRRVEITFKPLIERAGI